MTILPVQQRLFVFIQRKATDLPLLLLLLSKPFMSPDRVSSFPIPSYIIFKWPRQCASPTVILQFNVLRGTDGGFVPRPITLLLYTLWLRNGVCVCVRNSTATRASTRVPSVYGPGLVQSWHTEEIKSEPFRQPSDSAHCTIIWPGELQQVKGALSSLVAILLSEC